MSIKERAIFSCILVSIAVLVLGGCCRYGGVEEVPMSLAPSEVEVGQEVVVLVEFERAVFSGGRVDARNVFMLIEDDAAVEVGRLEYRKAVFDWENESLDVDGAVVDGTIVGSTTLELVLSFDEDGPAGLMTVFVAANDDGVECWSEDYGEAVLTVQ